MKDTVIQTTWRHVVDNIPPVLSTYKPKPKRTRYKSAEDREANLAARREKYKRTYVSKRKAKLIIELDALEPIPRKKVEVINYAALLRRLKQGPMLIEAHEVENLRIMLRYRGVHLTCRTKRADVGGVRIDVSEVRIKE